MLEIGVIVTCSQGFRQVKLWPTVFYFMGHPSSPYHNGLFCFCVSGTLNTCTLSNRYSPANGLLKRRNTQEVPHSIERGMLLLGQLP